MFDQSVSYYLSEYWANTPLYAEKIIPLLDYVLTNNFEESSKLSQAFYEIINKYTNTADLPTESLKELIRESGYGYLIDLLTNDDTSLKVLVYLLVLVHQLKGSKEGIQIVLNLFQLNANPDDTVITQWFESTPVGEENTFTIDSQIDISKASKDFFRHFNTFISNYVYPELASLKIKYTTEAIKTQIPLTRLKIKYISNGIMPV